MGLSIATRHPDLRGTFSTPFFWSQGLPRSVLGSDMAIAEALIDRVEGWEAGSGGALRIVRSAADLGQVGPRRTGWAPSSASRAATSWRATSPTWSASTRAACACWPSRT